MPHLFDTNLEALFESTKLHVYYRMLFIKVKTYWLDELENRIWLIEGRRGKKDAQTIP